MIDPTTIPQLPVDVTVPPIGATAPTGFDEVYLLYNILNDIQAGLGDSYLATYTAYGLPAALEAYINVQVPQNAELQSQFVSAAATIVSDITNLSDGNPLPAIIDALSATGNLPSLVAPFAGTLSQYLSVQNTPAGSPVTVEYPTGSSATTVTTTYNGPNGTGGLARVDQENANGTSEITTFNSDGSWTETTYSSSHGTGPATGSIIENSSGSISATLGSGYQFTPIADLAGPNQMPGSGTFATGINDSGVIVGYFTNNTGSHGFELSNGVYTTIDAPNVLPYSTEITGISNSGLIDGSYYDASTNTEVVFIDNAGSFTLISFPSLQFPPGNTSIEVGGINNSGVVVGETFTPGQSGFDTQNGTAQSVVSGYLNGINDLGVAVGSGASAGYGFFTLNIATHTLTNFPAIGNGGTIPYAINNLGVIVGEYFESTASGADAVSGFVDNNGSIQTISIPGAVDTIVRSTNDNGTIVGYYIDSNDQAHAFIGTPTNGTSITLTPLAGQTQALSDVLADPSLTSNGAVQDLLIQGPGAVESEGDVSIPSLTVDGGGNLLLNGGTLNTDPVTVITDGNISGYGTITGAETVNGTITASGGTLDLTGSISGTGVLTLAAGATLQLEGAIAAAEGLAFTGGQETLVLGATASVLAPVGGFGLGDAIGLEGQQVIAAKYSTSTNLLTLTGSGGANFVLTLIGTYQQSNFALSNGEVVWSANVAAVPTVSGVTPAAVEEGQTTVIGTVTPGRAGDALTLTETAGAGTLSLGVVQANGAQQVIYTAPDVISASAIDKVAYTVSENGASATGTASVQLDSGPSIALQAFALSGVGHAVTLATATPGLSADELSLEVLQAPTGGSLALNGNEVQYTPSVTPSSKPVTFSFEVKDQLGGLTPAATVIVGGNLVNSISGSAAGDTDISLGNGINKITLAGSGNVVDAGLGADSVSGGVSNNIVVLGNGLDSVNFSGGGNRITLGSGADAVTVGGTGNQITLGSGIDVVHGGTGDTISLAHTLLTLYGSAETVLTGSGNATLNDFSTRLRLEIGPTAGAVILSHFASDPSGVIELINGIGGFASTAAVVSSLRSDGHGGTLLSFGHGSSIDFTGLAPSQLHASNFEIG
jgi:hypothetical protein